MRKRIIQKIVLAAVIFQNNKILILQRNKNEEIFPNMWELPSGKKEFLESSEDCLKREIKEETGLAKIKIIMPFSIFDYQIEKGKEIRDSIQINFLVKTTGFEKVRLSNEHQDFIWIEKERINQYELSKDAREAIRIAFELKEKIF